MGRGVSKIERQEVAKVACGEPTWNAAIRIDALVWFFLEVFDFNPAGLVGQAEFFKNH